MKQNYTYQYRLYPTETQKVLLAKHFGCARFVFNHYLARRVEFYLETKEKDAVKKSLNFFDTCGELTGLKAENPWLKEVNSQSLQASLKNLDGAYSNFFAKRAKFPKFKKRHGRNSFRVPQSTKVCGDKVF